MAWDQSRGIWTWVLKVKRSVLLTHYSAGDKIEKNEMGGVCSAYGGGERCVRVLVGKPEVKEGTGETRA
jgi:hypothetical protein